MLVDFGASLDLSRVIVTGNDGGDGAGIFNSGTVTASETTFGNNHAVSRWGGGVYNNAAAMTLDRVTISGNTADRDGGGIYNFGVGSTLSMVNVTISGNTATRTPGCSCSQRALPRSAS